MSTDASRALPIRDQHDIARVRRAITGLLSEIGARPTEATRFVTAASELARNTLIHGGGGTVTVRVEPSSRGSRVSATFEDSGPGIRDLGEALRDGFTTAGGLGLGLGGAKRLCETFEIRSAVGNGTRVMISSSIGRR